jgi:hypothetical protein
MDPNNLVPVSPLEAMAKASAMRFAARCVSFGGENDLFPPKIPSEADGLPCDAREAALLLSFTSIAENEVRSMGKCARLWDDDSISNLPRLPGLDGRAAASQCSSSSSRSANPHWRPLLVAPRRASPIESSTEDDSSDSTYSMGGMESPTVDSIRGRRLRSVSIDSPESPPAVLKSGVLQATSLANMNINIVSPLSTPVLVKTTAKLPPKRKTRAGAAHKKRRSKKATLAPAPAHHLHAAEDDKKRTLKTVALPKGKIKTIMRKKFSWKNYPEVRTSHSPLLACIYVCARLKINGLANQQPCCLLA